MNEINQPQKIFNLPVQCIEIIDNLERVLFISADFQAIETCHAGAAICGCFYELLIKSNQIK
jgi:hypothetical protein